MLCAMGKITKFLVKKDVQQSASRHANKSKRQGTIHDMKKVQRLRHSSMCVDEDELRRLLGELADDQEEQTIDKALKHLASYNLQMKHLEHIPLAPRIKQLRQHHNSEIRKTATNLIEKLRDQVAAATVRKRQTGGSGLPSKPPYKQQKHLQFTLGASSS